MQIVLSNISREKAETVKKALEPDNVNFPEGLSLCVENVHNKLVFNFESRENMKQLISTIDEVLEHAQVALEVIQ